MAKRKRLSPASPDHPRRAPEVKGFVDGWEGAPPTRRAAPIADVAGDAATRAALDEVSHQLSQARTEGRLITKVPLASIDVAHLVRDRVGFDADEMASLKASMAARGQQTPIELVALGGDRFGLISGWRRIEALGQLGATEVLALVRAPQGAAQAYLAMIEENEIRANLSFYERARLAAEAARIGVYPTTRQAVAELFAAAPPPKRSKILKFVTLHDRLGDFLAFPSAIPERLGLALATALETDASLLPRLRDRLRKSPARDAETERRQLEQALRGGKKAPPAPPAKAEELSQGLFIEPGRGRVVISGAAVDAALVAALKAWLRSR